MTTSCPVYDIRGLGRALVRMRLFDTSVPENNDIRGRVLYTICHLSLGHEREETWVYI